MAPPRVLLIYANPAITAQPVPPYGMEVVARAFGVAGCAVRMEAPWIEADPLAAFEDLLAWKPDLIGFSVRNIDDALVVRAELGPGELDISFYLDAVRPMVQRAVQAVGAARVVLGGAAVSSGAAPVTRYLGARRAIRGPAEDLCWALGKALAAGYGPRLPADDPRVVELSEDDAPASPPHASPETPRGWGRNLPNAEMGATPRIGAYLGLTLARGGRIPVRVSTGCDRRCNFCVEARFTGYTVRPRAVEAVVAEIEALHAVGVRRFWLGCSELNVPHAKYAKELLGALAGRDLDLGVFMQPAPMDDELLDAFEAAGVHPTDLSFEFGHLDPDILAAGGGPASRRAIDRLVDLWLKRGYPELGGSVLLGSHPLETDDTLQRAVEDALAIDAALPRGLGLAYACGGRVYPETGLADWIAAHRDEAAPHLYTADGAPPDPAFVRPVVFCRPRSPRRLMAWVKGALAGAKGHIAPMNSEAPASEDALAAEALVNRGIVRIQEDRLTEAAADLRAALARSPDHLEALAQLSMLLANRLGDASGARAALSRLRTALDPDDRRRVEVDAALDALGE
ncbi:MAG: radical SAM protein [Alphaproteobacteria bacterium]|nr:radical SAM protein [Alphaproteobacteria bacterium]